MRSCKPGNHDFGSRIAALLAVALLLAACTDGATSAEGPRRFVFDGDTPCGIDFSPQNGLPIRDAASIPTDSGTVWVQTLERRLGHSDEAIDDVGVGFVNNGLFTLSLRVEPIGPFLFETATEIVAPESLESVIATLAQQAAAAPDHAAVVALVEAAVGATATYSGPASAYDLRTFSDSSDSERWLYIAGQPLDSERNMATWGSYDADDAPGLTTRGLSASEDPAVVDGQILYYPSASAPTEVTPEQFRDLIESLVDAAPTMVVTESAALAYGCSEDRELDSGAVELAAADIITAHRVDETPNGWRLEIDVDPPPGFVQRDGTVLNLFFGSSIRLAADLDWDVDAGRFVMPERITFESLLTNEEAEFFDRLLGA